MDSQPDGKDRAEKPATTITRRQFIEGLGGAALLLFMTKSAFAGSEAEDASSLLEPIRTQADLPALASVSLKDGRVIAKEAVGFRKYGNTTPVTIQDQFHLGSCTKALTAHLCANLIERGSLRRETPLAQALPEMKDVMHPSYWNITLDHLLSHRSGFPAESWLKGKDFQETRHFPGTPAQQRDHYLNQILREPPEAALGTKYIYSNRNYVVAGVLAERAAGTPWEELLSLRVFQPLGISSAGYGAMGTPGRVDQPWQHLMKGTTRIPIGPGPNSDNPPALGPAGTVHMSPEDWARFVSDHLKGLRGEQAHLQPESYHYLHTPLFGGDYMGGWIVTERPWGGGRVFTHSGSNTQNYAVVWMAPFKNFAVLVATNQGGDVAASACDKVAATMIHRFLG
jgi:CubicO group peptidase (beta-lactamase class C family)